MEGNQDSPESVIQIKEPGFSVNDCNPESKFHFSSSSNPEIHGVKSNIQDCLELPYMKRFVMVIGLCVVEFRE